MHMGLPIQTLSPFIVSAEGVPPLPRGLSVTQSSGRGRCGRQLVSEASSRVRLPSMDCAAADGIAWQLIQPWRLQAEQRMAGTPKAGLAGPGAAPPAFWQMLGRLAACTSACNHCSSDVWFYPPPMSCAPPPSAAAAGLPAPECSQAAPGSFYKSQRAKHRCKRTQIKCITDEEWGARHHTAAQTRS